ncbi:MAG: hypothetical protein PHV34_22050 [Verrucomicrobiae bacterium]|nr:hypothetical protein [Verrucomicrobiae bacterium]
MNDKPSVKVNGCHISEITDSEGIRVVELGNSLVRMGVVPDEGGRVAHITSLKSGRNHLSPVMAGIEDVAGELGRSESYPGAFATLAYQCRSSKTGQGMAVTVSASKGWLKLERTMRMDGGIPRIGFHVVYENTGRSPLPFKARIHPKFNVGGGRADEDKVYIPGKDGVFSVGDRKRSEDDIYDPSGGWMLAFNPRTRESVAAIHRPSQMDQLYPWGVKTGKYSYNLEYFGKEKTVAPGERCEMDFEYWVIADREDLDALEKFEDQLESGQKKALLGFIAKISGNPV